MQERITVMGRVAADPQRIATKDPGAAGPVTFRFATNDSRWDEASREWVDAGTNWYTVKAWRTLADHVLGSVSKGEPLLIHGRLELTVWSDQAGRERVTPTIHAEALGHDLRRGVSSFTARASEQGTNRSGSGSTPLAPSSGASQTDGAEGWANPGELADLPF